LVLSGAGESRQYSDYTIPTDATPTWEYPLGGGGRLSLSTSHINGSAKKKQNRAEKKPAQNNCFPLSNNFLYLGFPTAFAPNKACQWAWPCSVLYLAQQIELSVKKKKRIRKIQKCKECWPSPAKTG